MKQNRITIRTQEEGRSIGDLFGIFFEDLNHAADGDCTRKWCRTVPLNLER